MKTQDRLPDFLIIGAGKSGTTAMLNFLGQHPEVFLPHRKEPNFFAIEGIQPEEFESEPAQVYHRRSINNYQDYRDLFENAGKNQVVGENSNLYLYSKKAIENINNYVPQAKMIALLRNPTERLLSRYNHLVREGSEPQGDIEEIFDQNSIWWKQPDLIIEGFYGKYLEEYYRVFNNGQLKVVLYDDFRSNTLAVMKDIYRFIGVSPDFVPETDLVLNKSGKMKQNAFNKFLGQNGIAVNILKRSMPSIHEGLKKNISIQKVLTKWRNKNLETIKFTPEIEARITEEIFLEDIHKLERILNKSLKSWYSNLGSK